MGAILKFFASLFQASESLLKMAYWELFIDKKKKKNKPRQVLERLENLGQILEQ